MKSAPWTKTGRPSAAWRAAMRRLGFTSSAPGCYEQPPFRIDTTDGWLMVTEPAAGSGTEVLANSARAGLWKCVRRQSRACHLFALPSAVCPDDEGAEAGGDAPGAMEQLLRWALLTARGELPAGWTAPELATVTSWFPRERLTVVAGEVLRQGEIVCEPRRLSLRIPIIPPLPELPSSRRAWLGELLAEAQDRWHLARCEWVRDDAGEGAVAVVDFTGAPPELLENLFVFGLDALRWAVQWLGEPADWLADVAVSSELLAICPNDEP